MFKKKPFIVFEGIECSGKSFHSNNVAKELKRIKKKYIKTREPGGSINAELIRKLILKKSNKKFDYLTDTLLYLAARNENFKKNIKPNYHRKIIICDRFVDSTIAYQHYGLGVSKNLILTINKDIINNYRPDFTFLLIVNLDKLFIRLKKRRNLNRYDMFKKSFYNKVQKGFLKISKLNKNKYMIINSDKSIEENKKIILDKINQLTK
tara:strand:- start:2009 stop:2632 length:624 start_codon:yes stop_codon:yes gene_type:complete